MLKQAYFISFFLFFLICSSVHSDELQQLLKEHYATYTRAAEKYNNSLDQELSKEERDRILQEYIFARRKYSDLIRKTTLEEPDDASKFVLPNNFDVEGYIVEKGDPAKGTVGEPGIESHQALFEHYLLQRKENFEEAGKLKIEYEKAKHKLSEASKGLALTPWLNIFGKIKYGFQKMKASLLLRKAKKKIDKFDKNMALIKKYGLDRKDFGELTADDVRNYVGLSSGFEFLIHSLPGEHYEQNGFMPSDPVGDAHLIRKIDQVPLKLVKHLAGIDEYPQGEEAKDVKKERDYEIGKQKSVIVENMKNRIVEVIQELQPQIQPKKGKEPEWSPEAKKYMRFGFFKRLGRFMTGKQKDFPSHLLFRSKLFLCLAVGYTNRFMKAGCEKELTNKILSYPDGTVKPDDFFKEAYKLCDGDIFRALLACENVLASNPYRKDRGEDPLQKKLIYLRNDSKKTGDNYGAWYHFFGIALYGYARKGVTSRTVAEIESLGSIAFEGFDKQEDQINREGARFGKLLQDMANKKEWEKPIKGSTDYLNLDEFK
ncbi:hypothetical protein ACFL35_02410 [Candidatus Riflebacteria bacterium]